MRWSETFVLKFIVKSDNKSDSGVPKVKINIITLAVHHLEKTAAFYREVLQLPEDQVSKGEDHIAFFFDENFSLVLYPREEVASTTGQLNLNPSSNELILSSFVESRQDVDDILRRATLANGNVIKQGIANEWGYSGYFADPDGHVWEISTT